jgi:hypothetical protein
MFRRVGSSTTAAHPTPPPREMGCSEPTRQLNTYDMYVPVLFDILQWNCWLSHVGRLPRLRLHVALYLLQNVQYLLLLPN